MTSKELSGLDIARQLLEDVRLQGADLDAHVEQALSPEYWRSLDPSLSVGADPAPELTSRRALEPARRYQILSRFAQEGYLQIDDLVPPAVIARMHASVARVIAADWPAVFTWIYDEFWRVPRLPQLVDLFSAILGLDYRQTPSLWTHVVPGQRDTGGWSPHVDNPGPEVRLTAWIPLSDASLDLGCMFVIPKHMVPDSLAGQWHERRTLEMGEANRLLQASRPLVARPGAVLAWDAGLIHWGSNRLASGEARSSFSMEFANGSESCETLTGAMPGSGEWLPTHEHRLRVIATAIITFHDRDLRVARYVDLAHRLIERLGKI